MTNAALHAPIATTARNPAAVASLGLAVSDPPTQGEVQAVVNKIDELRRRAVPRPDLKREAGWHEASFPSGPWL